MNIELKSIRKFSFLHLALTHFWSGLESEINLIQCTKRGKAFPLGSLLWASPGNIPSKWEDLIMRQRCREKDTLNSASSHPQQFSACAEHSVPRFLAFQPVSLPAQQSQNLLQFSSQDNLDGLKVLIFKTRRAGKLILRHHELPYTHS